MSKRLRGLVSQKGELAVGCSHFMLRVLGIFWQLVQKGIRRTLPGRGRDRRQWSAAAMPGEAARAWAGI